MTSNLALSWPPIVCSNSHNCGLQTRSITASDCIFKAGRLLPAGLHDHDHKVDPQSCMITASKVAQSQPPSVAPYLVDYGLQVHIIMVSKCTSPNSLNYNIQVHLQPPSITASKSIYTFARPQSQSELLCSINHFLRVYLKIHSITAGKCICIATPSRAWSVSLSSLVCQFQTHLTLLSSTFCNLSRSTLCRWVSV